MSPLIVVDLDLDDPGLYIIIAQLSLSLGFLLDTI
jgi:hypothetical protein